MSPEPVPPPETFLTAVAVRCSASTVALLVYCAPGAMVPSVFTRMSKMKIRSDWKFWPLLSMTALTTFLPSSWVRVSDGVVELSILWRQLGA